MQRITMKIYDLSAVSQKKYELGLLLPGHYQYADRLYQFNYIPHDLMGCTHIITHGNDKLICEKDECFSFKCNEDTDVCVIYADKHPYLPKWLKSYERMRMNVTRIDTLVDNLKGYFSVYKKAFPAGKITLYGCSHTKMLAEDWYIETNGSNYCMYSVCVKPHKIGYSSYQITRDDLQ